MLFAPAASPSAAAAGVASVATKARAWARRGCLSAPVLAPLVPAPRYWPLASALRAPAHLWRSAGVAALSYASMQMAPPAACQSLEHAPAWGGLQGDCQAQQEVWRNAMAQTWDGVSLGLATGVVVVAGFALAGAAVGAVQSVGQRRAGGKSI